MPFKVRDLLITVLPQHFDLGLVGQCDAGSATPPGPPPPPPGPDSITFARPDIQELRLVLQLALTQLGGPLTKEELHPRTVRELHTLEQQLASSLEEVRELQRKMGVAGLK